MDNHNPFLNSHLPLAAHRGTLNSSHSCNREWTFQWASNIATHHLIATTSQVMPTTQGSNHANNPLCAIILSKSHIHIYPHTHTSTQPHALRQRHQTDRIQIFFNHVASINRLQMNTNCKWSDNQNYKHTLLHQGLAIYHPLCALLNAPVPTPMSITHA